MMGNDATRTYERILGIDFRDDQRHIGILTELAGVVDHHGTVPGDGLRKLSRCTRTGTGESNVNTLEVIIVLEQLHFVILPLEGVLTSG